MTEPGAGARQSRGVMVTIALSWRIFQRTIGAKYRKSFLGYFWMVAPALLITGAVTLANQAGVLPPVTTTLPYWLFVLLGTLLWQTFAEAIDVPHQAFDSARSYLTRVYFPREAIVLAQLYESMLTTAVRLLLAATLVACTHGFHFGGTLMIGVCYYGAVLLGLGLGALLMPFTHLFADLHRTIRLVIGYGLFLTPAMYQPQGDGWFATIVRCNPVTPLMCAARQAAAGEPLTQPLALVLAGGVLATVAGLLLVRAVAPIVIERMLLGGR